MTHAHQDVSWARSLSGLQAHRAWSTVSQDGRWFIELFQGLLKPGLDTSDTARANISRPFTTAVKKLLRPRGITVDRSCVTVEVAPGLNKTADISFTVGEEQWIIEIKQNLDFASLASAALQGACYKARHLQHKHMLLCLYSKHIRGDFYEALRVCNLDHAFDHVIVLTKNALKGDDWYEDFAIQLNAFVMALPHD
jgi:hypothetical protein